MRFKQTNCKWCNSDKGYTATQECDRCREIRANHAANADLQIADLQAEIIRLRAGGCARDQHSTQYCGELQSLVARLTSLADDVDRKAIDENDERYLIAQRIREAIDGGIK